MIKLFQTELDGFIGFLKSYWREVVIVASATLFLILDKYQPIGNEWQSSFIYFAVFPVLVILVILVKNPLDFGLRPGSPRIWGFWVAVVCLLAAAILYAASFAPSLQNYYLAADFSFGVYFLTNCISLSASEFIYRGFLLFGLKDKFKEGSILLQMVPFALLHIGKPELETVSTVLTGILFGYVAYRGRSYWPAFIIHLFINVFFVALINFKYS